MEQTTTRSFVRTYLPWLVAASALLLYVFTLDRVVTLVSIVPLARATGLDWHPVYIAPLNFLVTYPVRWLPPGVQLVGLNLIAAVCASLALALLARSVAILPHDRTHEQRVRERHEQAFLSLRTAWIPPLFAALICGLQLTFWENAIVGTGEMIDLLLFAYVIRCLLEYRIDERDSWLFKMALVYGMGMANNFAFIAFFPALLVATLWIKGLRLFEFSFLPRFVLFGVLGLLLYLVLPLVHVAGGVTDISFWAALKTNLAYQKQILTGVPRWIGLWLGGYGLVLLLVAGLRWSSNFGDTSTTGSHVGALMMHVVHAGLLAFVVYMLFDPPGSPRHLGYERFGLAFLLTYYMAALAAGYFAGYLLLVFSDFKPGRPRRRLIPFARPLSYAVTIAICATVLIVPAALIWQNLPTVRAANSRHYHDYAVRLAESLPAEGAVILSDDPYRLYSVYAVAGAEKRAAHLFVDTRSLSVAGYHRYLWHHYGDRWPKLPAEVLVTPVPSIPVLQTLLTVKQKQELFYLHPSFGFYFETFFQQPHDLVYRLHQFTNDVIEPPAPDAQLIARQNELWARLDSSALDGIREQIAQPSNLPRLNREAIAAGVGYSRAADFWGVELQRAGRFEEAARMFNLALDLNPDNASAFINREANTRWRTTGKPLERLSDEAERKLRMYPGGFDALITANGPVDEASFNIELAQRYLRNAFARQAAQQALRALAYAPNEPGFKLVLANAFILWQRTGRALDLVSEVRAATSGSAPSPSLQIELARTEAAAHFANTNYAKAEELLRETVRRFPEEDAPYSALSQYYLSRAELLKRAGDAMAAQAAVTNAIQVGEQQVKLQPQNPAAYFNQGLLYMQANNFKSAIESFTKTLQLQPKNYPALMNRAITNLRAKNLDAAQRDYESLLGITTTDHRIYYGLGEIAYQKQDWDAARENYEKYLQYKPGIEEEVRFVRQRLAEAKDRD